MKFVVLCNAPFKRNKKNLHRNNNIAITTNQTNLQRGLKMAANGEINKKE